MTKGQLNNIRQQIVENFQSLKSKGYDTDNWAVEEFVSEAVDTMEATGNTSVELRYDGVKYFTVSI